MFSRPILLLGLAISAASFSACSGSAKETGTATAAPSADAEKAKKKKGRSYDNPNAALSDEEKDDILHICSAIVQCDDQKLSGEAEKAVYKSFKPQSEWGKLMVKHLQSEGRAKAGSRVARLLKQEDMKWASQDCRTVIKRYANTYQ